MKILWIYNQHHPSIEYDHWLHMDFAEYFNNMSGIYLRSYGKNLEKYSSALKWEENKTIQAIYEEWPFDAVIVNTKGRCFDYYAPHTNTLGNSIIPGGFKDWKKTPKVMIEEDFQYETNLDWYVEMGFDYLINRHYSNFIKSIELNKNYKMNFGWKPFSVNTNIFKPRNEALINQVCFIGNHEHEIYEDRRQVIDILLKELLIINFGPTVTHDNYVKTLGQYTVGFCGVTTFNLTPAKIFEIMASGSVLLINNVKESGVDLLFSPDEYVTFKSDYSDLIKQTKTILNDHKSREQMTNKVLKKIKASHCHEVAISNLVRSIIEL